MVDPMEIIINVLVYINLYWYLMPVVFIPAFYYIFIKIFSFPLASNKSHEFVITARPEKVSIKKVVNRYYPFFYFKKGLYWFSNPCSDVNTYSKYHIYIEGINQDVTEMERRESKLDDIIQTKISTKQLGSHTIRLPLKIKDHLHRHWALTIEPTKKLVVLTPVKDSQPFKISLYHTLGIFIQEQQEVEKEVEGSSSSGQVLTAITTQAVIQQIKYVQSYSYFSSSAAFNLWKKRLRMDQLFVTWLKGSIDPRIMAIIIIMCAGIGSAILLMMSMKGSIGEMPVG